MLRTRDEGFTLIELLMVVAIIGIIAAVATPGLLRARQAANESSAISALRSIGSAQSAFLASCGGGYYAATLEVLATPPSGGSPFIDSNLATTNVVKSLYRVAMASDVAAPDSAAGCVAGALGTGFHVTAVPVSGGGTREFGTNAMGTIFFTVLPDEVAISDTTVTSGTPLR